MATVPQFPTLHKSHRRAEGRGWTWADYGLVEHLDQQALVVAALGQGR